MSGFIGCISGNRECETLKVLESGRKCDQYVITDSEYVELRSIPKFKNDKCCSHKDNYTIVIDGVILNLSQLLLKYKCLNLSELSIQMYEMLGEDFFKEFRGNFSGIFCDRKNDKALIFTNHIGDKPVFYFEKQSEGLIAGSEVKYVLEFMKKCKEPYSLDIAGAYAMLTLGYMYHDMTMISEIKRLIPGHYLRVQGGKAEQIQYYAITNEPRNKVSKDEAIEEIQRLFKMAVKAQVDKNKEYGYENMAPLSGGLDSRMTTYGVSEITPGPILNITFSETGQFDQRGVEGITRELGNHWIFKNLDNGLFLYDIEESARIGDGLMYYLWPAMIRDMTRWMDMSNIGVVHTGVFTDIVIGTFYDDIETEGRMDFRIGDGGASTKLISKFKGMIKEIEYDNYEMGLYYNRTFNGVCLGNALPFQEYTEAMSPFTYVELMDFGTQLPLEYRRKRDVYYRWVNKYYPAAAKHKHNGVKIPTFKYPTLNVGGRTVNLEIIPSRIQTKIQERTDKKYGMNPFEYWYKTNSDLRKLWKKYYKEQINCLDAWPDLKKDTEMLYNKGNTMEKSLVLSLIATVKEFFEI